MGGITDFVGDVVGDVAGGLFGGDDQKKANQRATDAQVGSIQESNQLQRDIFNANAGLSEFQRGIGNQALAQLGGLYGFEGGYDPAGTVRFDEYGELITEGPQGTPGERQGTPNFSNFLLSPEYQFALQQGQQGIDQNRAARGNLFSGGAAKEASRFNQGLATQQFGNYTNNLARLAGIGTNSTNMLGNTLQNTGANIGNGLQSMGNTRASGYVNDANIDANNRGQLINLGLSGAQAAVNAGMFTGGGLGGGGAVPNYSPVLSLPNTSKYGF